MKFGKLTVLSLVAGALAFAACKYEDGPRMSLRAKRDRVANEWKIDKFELNDQDLYSRVNPVYKVSIPNPDTTITYEFATLVCLYRTGYYGLEIVMVKRDANNVPTYYSNHQMNFNQLPGCSTVYNHMIDSLPSPFKYIRPHGKWAFDKGHYKIEVMPDLSFVNDETGNAKNTLDWTITKLAEKSMHLKGLDENNKIWKVEFKAINKEPYFY